MPVERIPGSSSLIDVLDRILDKGIIVDGWARISLDGIDVVSDHARVIVASSDTHLAGRGAAVAQDQTALSGNLHGRDRVTQRGGGRSRSRG
jgi:hypothetical protein